MLSQGFPACLLIIIAIQYLESKFNLIHMSFVLQDHAGLFFH